NVLSTFQTKYRPARFTGEPDAETAAMLDVLAPAPVVPVAPVTPPAAAPVTPAAPPAAPAPVQS
ncbi:MAG TPA: N-acetylmuramoyl-L-alanine amidase, partial [Burkholderiaceae bacterium]